MCCVDTYTYTRTQNQHTQEQKIQNTGMRVNMTAVTSYAREPASCWPHRKYMCFCNRTLHAHHPPPPSFIFCTPAPTLAAKLDSCASSKGGVSCAYVHSAAMCSPSSTATTAAPTVLGYAAMAYTPVLPCRVRAATSGSSLTSLVVGGGRGVCVWSTQGRGGGGGGVCVCGGGSEGGRVAASKQNCVRLSEH